MGAEIATAAIEEEWRSYATRIGVASLAYREQQLMRFAFFAGYKARHDTGFLAGLDSVPAKEKKLIWRGV